MYSNSDDLAQAEAGEVGGGATLEADGSYGHALLAGGLNAGDILHIGLTFSLMLIGRCAVTARSANLNPHRR